MRKKLLLLKNKKGLGAGGLLGVILGVAAFWELLKWLIIGGIIGTGASFASPLLIITIVLGIIVWIISKSK